MLVFAKCMNILFDNIQLASIVESLNDAAFVVGESGTVLAANDHSDVLFEGSCVGKHLTLILRAPSVLLAINEAILHAKSARVSHVVRTPVQRTYDVHISPLGPSLALVMLRDLTNEEQFEQMRSDFVANASHELRTPLASLTGFIETMQGAAKNDTKAKDEFLKMMKAQADRMARLIDDLLSLSSIEISEHVAPTEIADLTQIAKQAYDLLSRTATDANCELLVALPKTLPVIGDANQLSQVVHNLMENAIKYAGSGKAIEIGGDQKNGMAILSIRDHGPGIAEHHVPRLTERFYRVNVQDSRNRGGTGLGLAICKHIINRHRGKLVIESELGQGSTFSVHLPLKILT